MALFRIIFFLLLLTPLMLFFSGCYSDSFLDAMKSEIDFISPFDVTITTEESKRTTYFPITDTGTTINIIGVSGDDGEYNNMTQPDSSNFEEQDVGRGAHDRAQELVAACLPEEGAHIVVEGRVSDELADRPLAAPDLPQDLP